MKRLKASKRNPISEIEKAEDEGEEEEEEEKEPRRDEVKKRRLTFADRLDRVEWRMTRELFKRDKKRKQDYIT